MNLPLDPEWQAQLEALRQQFANGLPTRFDVIASAIDACMAVDRAETTDGKTTDRPEPSALAALVTALHSLAGAAGTFGFCALGDQARDYEQQVLQWMESTCTQADIAGLRVQLARWRAGLGATPRATSQHP